MLRFASKRVSIIYYFCTNKNAVEKVIGVVKAGQTSCTAFSVIKKPSALGGWS